MLGTYVLSAGYYDAFYLKAQQVRTLLRRDYEQAFERVDVVAMPTSPTPPFQPRREDRRPAADVSRGRLHGQREPGRPAGHQRAVRLLDATVCRSALQFMGRMFDEATLLRVADAYERVTDWHTRAPVYLEPVFQRRQPASRSVLADVHRRHRHVAVLNGPDVGALRRGAAFAVHVPVDGASRRMLHLREALLAAARQRPAW